MKHGRTLTELAIELDRQRKVKKDYLLDTRNVKMDAMENFFQITLINDEQRANTILGVNDIAHRQIGSTLGIPAKYYDKMRAENPDLLSTNVNSWFNETPSVRMVERPGPSSLNDTAGSITTRSRRRFSQLSRRYRMRELQAAR